MDPRSRRVMAALGSLVLLWIFVYWAWSPHTAGVRFDAARPASGAAIGAGATGAGGTLDPELIEQGRRELADLLRGGGSGGGGNGGPPPAARADSSPGVAPSERTARVETPKTEVIAPAFREYTIRSGDTFEKIAQREYGSRARARAIAQANPLRDPRRLKPGDVIRLPVDPENVQGRRASSPATTGGGSALAKERAEEVRYTVKKGDSLSSIAKAYYGSAGFSEFIFEANRDVLDAPEKLSIGDVLRLPPAPGG